MPIPRLRALGMLVLVLTGCHSKVQRATILPSPAPASSASQSPADFRKGTRRYVVDRTLSRFELYGADVFTGEHRGRFHSWTAEVILEAGQATITATVETDSIELDMPGATGVLKRSLLETHRYPTATLSGTLSPTSG